jgi:serine/threonine-protein kinase
LGAALRREADAYAQLDHTSIPRLYDYQSSATQAWFVLEDSKATPLAAALPLPLDFRVALAVALQVTQALAHAHERGILHGRVSLEQLKLTTDGVVKLSGFGLSSRGDPGEVEPLELAQNAGISPEATLGQPASAAGDVFGLGCLLFELLTGQPPFGDASALDHDARVRGAAAPSILKLAPQVPSGLDEVVQRCLEKLPGHRPDSMAELSQTFATLLGEEPSAVIVRALAPGEPRERPISSRPKRARWGPRTQGLLLGVGLAAGVVTIFVVLKQRKPPEVVVTELPVDRAAQALSLRAVASPWAHVIVDGVRRETTPFASPLLLTPGKHEVRFEHPAAAPEIRHIDGAAGESVFLDVVLRVERSPLGPEAPSNVVDNSP